MSSDAWAGARSGAKSHTTLTISFAGSINPTKQIFTLSAKRLGPVLGLNDSQEINLNLKIQIPTKHLLHRQGII